MNHFPFVRDVGRIFRLRSAAPGANAMTVQPDHVRLDLARQCKANSPTQRIVPRLAAIQSNMTKRTVLVVDDNLDFAEGIAVLLESHGQPAMAVATVRAALDALDENPAIGLVVSDVRMPSVDGFDFHRVLKYRFASLPVVLMTGLPVTDEDNPPRDMHLLQKPFPIDELLKTIAERLPSD